MNKIDKPEIDIPATPESPAATLRTFGLGLRREWDKRKYPTDQSFADALEISLGRLDKLLSGKVEPSLPELWAINQKTGISLDKIMGI